MKFIRFLRRKIRKPNLLWLSLAVLTTILVVVGFGQPLNAQYTTVATSKNPWRLASFPVENSQYYSSPFGYRNNPVTGQRQFHNGLDIAAPMGSYVRSWWSGKVVELSDNTACGTMVQIQSGQWKHIYCHMMGRVENTPQGRYLLDQEGGIVLAMGQELPTSARIGRVGMTGRTTGPHLHWGLMYGNNYVDPSQVIQQMYTSSR
jgi:murein DD-endopeptidase MepM/ murein hydrolase activator NlpD